VKNTPIEDTTKRFVLFTKLCELRRQIAFSNPLLNFKELLFVKKHRATYNHMCDQYYGINIVAGGGVFVMDFDTKKLASGLVPTVKNLLANATVESGRLAGKKLTTGSFLSPDISYDAKKLAFAYVECEGDTDQRFHTDPSKGHWNEQRCFHIFTCELAAGDSANADKVSSEKLTTHHSLFATHLKQITDGTWNDFDPCWLPNGRMAFITERRGGYLRCGRACPTFTLFDMNPDGSMMRALSFHETNEWHPSVTNDGRILYTRWDYPDRHGCTAHMAWVTTLDGRDPRQVHGNFAPREKRHDMELDCRPIPDSQKFIATGAPHHGQSYGSLVVIDPQVKDDDAMAPVKRLTPDVAFPETQGGSQVYGAAYPLSENYYLCVADFSMNTSRGFEWQNKNGGQGHNKKFYGGDYGIYLVDAFGNKELIYRDPEIGCNSPMPIIARPTPPIVPQMISANIEHQPYLLPEREKLAGVEQGTVMINNVYETIRPYPAGTKLKELRVIQLIPMSTPSGGPRFHQPHETAFREPTSGDSVVLCRNVWGTVPIEDDGSVHLKVPPRREFQLQVIDEDGLAVQSMRSSIYLHDGETLSCTGCHEQQATAVKPITAATPKAFKRQASVIKPSFADAVNFSYPRLIQPIWDAHCVQCHTDERAKGTAKVPNLSRDIVPDGGNNGKWYASYKDLKPYVFYSYGERHRTMPGKFGARASKLYPLLKNGHYDVKLSEEELQKVALWLDCVSPFYGVYEKEGGEAQLRGEVAYPTLE
jgi:cytochrome c553